MQASLAVRPRALNLFIQEGSQAELDELTEPFAQSNVRRIRPAYASDFPLFAASEGAIGRGNPDVGAPFFFRRKRVVVLPVVPAAWPQLTYT